MRKQKQATIYLDEHVHRRLKIKAAHEGTTVSALVNEAMRRVLDEGRSGEPAQKEERRLSLNWAGALKDLRDQFSSVQLQDQGREWREE